MEFLADFVQHIPKPRQHIVTYAGYFANALHKLTPPKVETQASKAKNSRTRWAALILRTWQVDPELCPRCRKPMARSKTYDGNYYPLGFWDQPALLSQLRHSILK